MHVAHYAAGDWGVGELWFDDEGVPVWHELPTTARALERPGRHELAGRMAADFEGERAPFADLDIDLEWCTPLQRAIAEALRRVPYGETVSYGELAALAGRPQAPRAGGAFCSHNRLPLILPCHRVVAAGGIGGYGSLGVE